MTQRGEGKQLACDPGWPALVVFGRPYVLHSPPMLLHLLSLPVPAILPHIHINKNAQTHTHSRVTQHYYLHPSSDSPKPSCAGIWVLMKETEFPNAKTTLKQAGYHTIVLERLRSCSSALARNRACFSTFGFHFAWNLNNSFFSDSIYKVLHNKKKPVLVKLLQTKQTWDFWLNGGAICLSPMPRNQLSLLGLEIKCIAECDCKQREWEKEWNKKSLKKSLKDNIFTSGW